MRQNIRIALQAAGADVSKHPVAASDWGIHLRRTVIRKSSRHLIVLKKGIFILSNVPVVILTGILRAIRVMAGSLISVKTYAVYKEKDVKYSYYRLNS